MTNADAIKRIQQKIEYLSGKIATTTDVRQRFWQERDLEAFELAIAALQYAEQMAEYEASQITI